MVDGVDRPKPSGVDHVGLSVTDLDRSIAFYCDELGALLAVAPFEGYRGFSGRMAVVLLGMTIIDLYEHEANCGERFEPGRTGLDHLALAAESYEEVESTHGRVGWTREVSHTLRFGTLRASVHCSTSSIRTVSRSRCRTSTETCFDKPRLFLPNAATTRRRERITADRRGFGRVLVA